MNSNEAFYKNCLKQTREALKQEDYKTALKKATMAVSINPLAEAYHLRVQCLIEVNDLDEAEQNLEKSDLLISAMPEDLTKEALLIHQSNLVSALKAMKSVKEKIEDVQQASIKNGNPLALLPAYELQQHERRLASLANPSIKIKTLDGLPAQTGQSKFGGTPDGIIAPATTNGTPLPLVLQINFAELKPLVGGLPEHGLLYFFFDPELCEHQCNSPADRRSWKVVYEQKPNFKTKTHGKAKWKEVPVEFSTINSLPSVLAPEFQNGDFMTASELERYHILLQKFHGPLDHRLFGHPGLVQPEYLGFHAELLVRAIDVRKAMSLDRSLGEKYWQASHSWGLLAQIDWNPPSDMWWGNYGRLTFWIKNEDLARANFNNVMLQWQTHTVLLSMFPETFANTEHCLAARNALWEKEIFNPWKSQLKP